MEGRRLEKHVAHFHHFHPTFFIEPDAATVRVESGKLAVWAIVLNPPGSQSEVGQDSHQGYLIEAMVDVGHVKQMPWNCLCLRFK